MITVHHLENSRSQRVLWLLEELKLGYDLVRYPRDPKTLRAPPALRAVHPLGKSPVVTDGEHTLAESGAILEYLVERYGDGRLSPATHAERLRYKFFLHYAEGSVMPYFLLKLITSRLGRSPTPALIRPVARLVARGLDEKVVNPELTLHIGYIEAELGKYPWFAGNEFSAADIQMSFVVELALERGGALAAGATRLADFVSRIRSRPAYQRALERGGPYRVLS